MADLQEQLQAILGDPEAMGQITAIARALTGSDVPPPPAPEPEAQDVDYIPVDHTGEEAPAPEEEPTGSPSPGEGQGPDLSALFSLLGNGNLPDIDPRLIQIALRVYSEYSSQDDDKAALLGALKPFLRQERREKMEKAEKIARLSRVVRVALQLLKEEGDSHV